MKKTITDNRDIREIDEIIFGVYSAEEIKKIAVCEVNNSKLSGSDKNTGYGTVYDPRMGTIENGKQCETCTQNIWGCVGHFGYITLNESIIHPLHYKRVVDFLRCFCTKCFKLLITYDQIVLNNLSRILGVKRFNKILEKLEKIDMCPHCSQPQPDIKYTAIDNSIAMVYKDKDKSKVSIILPVDEIKNIFDNISVDDVKLLGFNPDLMQPKNLILTVFPVIPTACFMENTIILTDNGYKYIQDVKKTDRLYSHTGKFQKINTVFINNYNSGEIYNIKVAFRVNIIKCTPEHPFYVKEINTNSGYENLNVEPEWVKAENLKISHFIGMKRNTNNIIPEFNFNKIDSNNNISTFLKKLDNLDEWFLIGYFLGNGLVEFNLQDRFYLYRYNKDEDTLTELLNKLNISFRISMTQEQTKIFLCDNFMMWNILKELGNSDYDKKIPIWVHDAPKEFVEKFLDGYCKANNYHNNRNQIQYKTISNDIAFSIQLLYIKLGEIADIYYEKVSDKIIETNHIVYNISVVKNRTNDLHAYIVEDDYIWFKITEITEDLYLDDITVYNFEVDEDNTYCVENIICHNCRPYILSENNICDDDLTIQLVEIIKANNHLKIEDGVPVSETKRQKYIQSLKFRISTFYNNSSGKAKHSTNGRVIKGLKERFNL